MPSPSAGLVGGLGVIDVRGGGWGDVFEHVSSGLRYAAHVEYTLGSGHEGADGDEADPPDHEPHQGEEREDHDATRAFEEADLAFEAEALGAGPGIGGHEREGHRR